MERIYCAGRLPQTWCFLPSLRGGPSVIFGGLHPTRTSCRKPARQGLGGGKVLELVGREKPTVGLTGPAVRERKAPYSKEPPFPFPVA